ncbi:MAG: hypothetical protein AB7V42_12690 [Thermoleophilia bacterium]
MPDRQVTLDPAIVPDVRVVLEHAVCRVVEYLSDPDSGPRVAEMGGVLSRLLELGEALGAVGRHCWTTADVAVSPKMLPLILEAARGDLDPTIAAFNPDDAEERDRVFAWSVVPLRVIEELSRLVDAA